MTGKQIVLAALRNERTERPAWVPFVGCHGGYLIEKSATEYLQSADLLVEGIERAIEQYRPDGLPVMFDLQMEAEILGCELRWADDVPPSVVTHPLLTASIEELPPFDPSRGRFPIVLEALRRVTARHGQDVAFYGLICGPFTLALHLLGHDIFLKMFDDPAGVKQLLDYCATVGAAAADAYIDHGAEVIAVVDPMTSQISPEHFEEFVSPSVDRLFSTIKTRGAFSSMFVCGDATRNLEVMCRTGADNISVDEQIDLERLGRLCRQQDKSFGGNIRLTSVLLLGNEDDSRREAIEIMDKAGSHGFILAPGCDLPYHTPPRNLAAIAEVVHDSYERDIARHAVSTRIEDTFEDVVPPPYHVHKEVIVDVITLDSTSCAPCQYMMEAVGKAADAAFVKTFVNEHRIKDRRGLGMMKRLGVKNLPTICIDGEIAFASMIPDHKTLVGAIQKRAVEKNL